MFTNTASWRGITRDIRNRVNWNIYPDKNNPIIMECVVDLNGIVQLHQATDLHNEGIYLVYDSIDKTQLKQLLEQCQQDKHYILLHSQGCQREDFLSWEGRFVIKEGLHVNKREKFYVSVFEIITDSEGNKLERIVEKVFTPRKEAVLELMNECLVPQKQLESFRAYQMLCENGFKSVLEEFRKKYESCRSYDEYKQDLVDLRKKLDN